LLYAVASIRTGENNSSRITDRSVSDVVTVFGHNFPNKNHLMPCHFILSLLRTTSEDEKGSLSIWQGYPA
jgi:hypothetical protein